MRVRRLVRSFSDLVVLILLIGFFYFGCSGPLLMPLGFSLLQRKSSEHRSFNSCGVWA